MIIKKNRLKSTYNLIDDVHDDIIFTLEAEWDKMLPFFTDTDYQN